MNKLLWLVPALGIACIFVSLPVIAGKPGPVPPVSATEDDEFITPYLLTGAELDRAEDAAKRGERF